MHYNNGMIAIKKNKVSILRTGIVLLFCLLSFLGLQKHFLWGDEAETALFARNILLSGIPKGWDGVNIMGLYNGTVLNEKLVNTTTPWAQYYAVAAAFKLFGESYQTARLPFYIFSLLSLVCFYYLGRHVLGKEKVVLVGLLILATSVPFIMYSYQSRYYAIATFSGIFLLYRFFIADKQWSLKNILCISAAGILFFHAHYLSFAAFYFACSIGIMMFSQNRKLLFGQIAVSSGIILLFTVPWIYFNSPHLGQSSALFINLKIKNGTELFLRYLSDLNEEAALPILFIPIYIWVASWQHSKITSYRIKICAAVYFLYLFFLSLLSPQRIDITPVSYVRYAINIYPVGVLLIAYALYQVYLKHKIVGILLCLITIFTNAMTMQMPPKYWLFSYLDEISNNNYQTSTEAVTSFLKDKITPGDQVFVTPDYNVEPLQFYFDKKITFINRISPRNSRILNSNNSFLPDHVYHSQPPPDWIIMFGKSKTQFNWRQPPANVDFTDYQETKLNVWAYDLTRPEISEHRFSPPDKIAEEDHVFVYQRIKKSP